MPVPTPDNDLRLMRRIDELHLESPFAGARMLRDMLRLEKIEVGRTHVSTLMKKMGIVELIRCAQDLGTPADWLVRAKHNRCLPEGQRLWSYTQAGEPLGEMVFTLASRHRQKARQVRQQLWARRLEIPAGKTGSVVVTCIVASEIGAPEGVTPVQWALLTNREALTLADVIELIDWYRARWEIEMFFDYLSFCTPS